MKCQDIFVLVPKIEIWYHFAQLKDITQKRMLTGNNNDRIRLAEVYGGFPFWSGWNRARSWLLILGKKNAFCAVRVTHTAHYMGLLLVLPCLLGFMLIFSSVGVDFLMSICYTMVWEQSQKLFDNLSTP